MRRLLGIILLLSLTVPITATYLILQSQKSAVRKEVKRQIIAEMDKSELVQLKFTINESEALKWEHSHEFEFNGNMFDIVEADTINGIISYWCWPDKQETALNTKLDKLAEQAFGHSKDKKSSRDRLMSFFKSLYFLESNTGTYIQGLDEIALSEYRAFFTPKLYYTPPVPPPEVV